MRIPAPRGYPNLVQVCPHTTEINSLPCHINLADWLENSPPATCVRSYLDIRESPAGKRANLRRRLLCSRSCPSVFHSRSGASNCPTEKRLADFDPSLSESFQFPCHRCRPRNS